MAKLRRKKEKSALAKQYDNSVSAHEFKYGTIKNATLEPYQEYFNNFKFEISKRDTDEANFAVFKRNWKALCSKSQTGNELIKGLHIAIKEFTKSPSKLKSECYTHLIDTIDKWETARDKKQFSTQNFTEAHCYSMMALPLREKTKNELFQTFDEKQSKNQTDSNPMFAWICAVQHLLTGDKDYKNLAQNIINQNQTYGEKIGQQQIMQVCAYFDFDLPFEPRKLYDDQPSTMEETIKHNIGTLYDTMPSTPLSKNFPHNVDIEIDTKNPDTRLFIEIDGMYHNAGYNEEDLLRLDGSTILQSHLTVKTAKETAENTVLLRLNEDVVKMLVKSSEEQFKNKINNIINQPIISDQMIIHLKDNEITARAIEEQYEPLRDAHINQELANLLASNQELSHQ